MINVDITITFKIMTGMASFSIIVINTSIEKADKPKIYKHSCIGKSRHVALKKPDREQKAKTVKSKGIDSA